MEALIATWDKLWWCQKLLLRIQGCTCTPLHLPAGAHGPISRFGERFRDGQYSLVSFFFAVLLLVPPCPAICKSWGHVPCPIESAPLKVLVVMHELALANRVVQNGYPVLFWDNFGNSAPILTILSLLQAEIYGA